MNLGTFWILRYPWIDTRTREVRYTSWFFTWHFSTFPSLSLYIVMVNPFVAVGAVRALCFVPVGSFSFESPLIRDKFCFHEVENRKGKGETRLVLCSGPGSGPGATSNDPIARQPVILHCSPSELAGWTVVSKSYGLTLNVAKEQLYDRHNVLGKFFSHSSFYLSIQFFEWNELLGARVSEWITQVKSHLYLWPCQTSSLVWSLVRIRDPGSPVLSITRGKETDDESANGRSESMLVGQVCRGLLA